MLTLGNGKLTRGLGHPRRVTEQTVTLCSCTTRTFAYSSLNKASPIEQEVRSA